MAEYQVNITEKDIENAVLYTKLSGKEQIARSIGQLCVEPVEVVSNETETLPPMFRENRKLRQQFQMGILAFLLRREYPQQTVKIKGEDGASETPIALCMDEDCYDEWAESHVMNQLERLKKSSNKEMVNRIFDILYEYKAFELMISGAIRDELEVLNDGFNRAMRYFSVAAVDAAVKSMVDGELSSLAKEAAARKVEADG